jgi:hypothetical protein
VCLFPYNISAGVRVTILFDLYRRPTSDYYHLAMANSKLVPPATSTLGVPTEVMTEKVRGGIDALLSGGRPAVAVCLSHKYPLCQASRDFLKGGDRALYDFLCRHYSVEISAIVVRSTLDHDGSCEEERSAMFAGRFAAAGGKKKSADTKDKQEENVLLIVPAVLGEGLIRQVDFIEYTGNESQPEELTYLVTAVIITDKY